MLSLPSCLGRRTPFLLRSHLSGQELRYSLAVKLILIFPCQSLSNTSFDSLRHLQPLRFFRSYRTDNLLRADLKHHYLDIQFSGFPCRDILQRYHVSRMQQHGCWYRQHNLQVPDYRWCIAASWAITCQHTVFVAKSAASQRPSVAWGHARDPRLPHIFPQLSDFDLNFACLAPYR